MTYQEAIDYFGTQVRLAAALGIQQPSVSSWGKVIPDRYQYQLEIITGGDLLVDPYLRLPVDRAELLLADRAP